LILSTFDVDDPSTDDTPVDPNKSEGNDNRGRIPARAGALPGGQGTVSLRTDATGFLRVAFTPTMQPGDNFKVAVGCDASYLNSLEPKGDPTGAGGVVEKNGNPIDPTKAILSPMLTVWRTVHIELD